VECFISKQRYSSFGQYTINNRLDAVSRIQFTASSQASGIPFGSGLLNRQNLDCTTMATKYEMIVILGAVRVSAPRPGPHSDPGLCPDPR